MRFLGQEDHGAEDKHDDKRPVRVVLLLAKTGWNRFQQNRATRRVLAAAQASAAVVASAAITVAVVASVVAANAASQVDDLELLITSRGEDDEPRTTYEIPPFHPPTDVVPSSTVPPGRPTDPEPVSGSTGSPPTPTTTEPPSGPTTPLSSSTIGAPVGAGAMSITATLNLTCTSVATGWECKS